MAERVFGLPSARVGMPMATVGGDAGFGANKALPRDEIVRAQLFPGEDKFFRSNPTVSGMAADDNRVILNPYSNLSEGEKRAVVLNEYARIVMRMRDMDAPEVTAAQRETFDGTPYGSDDTALRRTIIARILSGDPSAGAETDEQRDYAADLARALGIEGR